MHSPSYWGLTALGIKWEDTLKTEEPSLCPTDLAVNLIIEATVTQKLSGITRRVTHWERERSIWWWWRETVFLTYLKALPGLWASAGSREASPEAQNWPGIWALRQEATRNAVCNSTLKGSSYAPVALWDPGHQWTTLTPQLYVWTPNHSMKNPRRKT